MRFRFLFLVYDMKIVRNSLQILSVMLRDYIMQKVIGDINKLK